MKKLLYSTALKAVAVILFIACITSGVLVVTDGIIRMEAEELHIYRFESSFARSTYMENLLLAPQYAVIEAYHNAYRDTYDSTEEITPELITSYPESDLTEESPMDTPLPDDVVAEYLAESLDTLYCTDKVNYCVVWNGRVFTNCDTTTPEDLIGGDFFIYTQRDQNGAITTRSDNNKHILDLFAFVEAYDIHSTVTVSATISSHHVRECQPAWNHQAAIVMKALAWTGLFALGALAMLIHLACVCGKTKNGEQRIIWIDYIWSELHLTAMAGAILGAGVLYIGLIELHLWRHFALYLLYPIVAALAVLTAAITLTSLLSILRNIKARRGIDASLILSVIRLLWRGLVQACRWIGRTCKAVGQGLARLLSRKAGLLYLVLLVVYTLLLICGVFANLVYLDDEFLLLWLIAAFVAFVLACWALVKRAIDLEELRKGVTEMQRGNVSYRIPNPRSEELKPLADSINGVAEGLDKAVADKVKAERMKAELITNVSHDLKTPLTSIINYTELLSQVEGLPEEARDYVEIIAKKNLRLKNLTRDLFDISRVQSGNEEMTPEKLDVALLIEQSLGELDSEIRAARLPFCVSIPKELYILADGRKMSRVVGNLLSNILKYAMENTRVFITASRQDGQISLEFKNVSASPLDFDPEEIVGRFVRGDESRTTEGSGLGLAIAKSYTELCGGRLAIILDGDLFKAILTFPPYPTEE